MIELSKGALVGLFGFLILLFSGAVDAIASAKMEILGTLLSVLFGLNYESEVASAIAAIMIISTMVVVFVIIPGKLGLFRMLTGQ